MRGSRIMVESDPRGVFLEGIVQGTPLPGTVMGIVPGVKMVGGRFTWEPLSITTPGDPRLIAVLLEDQLQGQVYSTAYVNGVRCFLYVPLPGEDINVLAAPEPGTGSANAYTIGERLTLSSSSSGMLIAEATSSVWAPFMSMEHIDFTADTAGLVWCKRQN